MLIAKTDYVYAHVAKYCTSNTVKNCNPKYKLETDVNMQAYNIL